MKTLVTAIVSSALWLTSPALFAHADLTESSPGEGAVVNSSPANIELNFSEEVRLLRFAIADNAGNPVATSFKPAATEQSHFAVALPALDEDSYTVNWAIMGDDGHLVEKGFTFTVDADAPERAGMAEESGVHSEAHSAH